MLAAEKESKAAERQMKRLEDNKQASVKLKKIMKQVPLYRRIKECYDEEIELPTLEQRKKTLADKRNLYKPLAKKDFIDHTDKYSSIKKVKLEEIKKKREDEMKVLE